MPQAMMTTIVPWTTWFWVGHSTFFSSAQDSETKRLNAAAGDAARAGLALLRLSGRANGLLARPRSLGDALLLRLRLLGSSAAAAALRSTPLAPALPRVPGH